MNKNLLVCAALLLLSGCLRADHYDILPMTGIADNLRSYSVYNFNDETNTGNVTARDNEIVMNKALTVKKGEAVLSDKFYDKSTFEKLAFIPNKRGGLHSLTQQLLLNPREDYVPDKYTKIDGVRYYLLASPIDDFYYLFDDDGRFYESAAIIKNDNLFLIQDEEIMAYPTDLKMNKILKNREEISNVRKGYEVKYAGAELDRIWFDLLNYDGSDSKGKFERISFPNQPGLITINGSGLRVLKADDDKITFMILSYEDLF
mgnify:CR=1 FL=1